MSISAEQNGLLRSSKVIVFAFIAIVLMLAAPLLTAFGSDASIAEDKAGYSIIMNNPTEQELEKYDVFSKEYEIVETAELFLTIFNTDICAVSELETGGYDYKASKGVNLGSNNWFQFMTEEVFVQGLSLTFIALDDGALIDPVTEDDIRYKEAADAVKAYLGNEISVGDTLSVKGKLNSRSAFNYTCDYAKVDDGHSVVRDGSNTLYDIYEMDIEITLTRLGETKGKAIQFHSDEKFLVALSIDYDYKGAKYSELTEESPCKITYSASTMTFHTGRSHYTVNGKDYTIGFRNTEKHVDDTTADILTDSEINLEEFRSEISKIPASEGNVTVKKNFGDAESVFDSIVLDVIGKDIFKGFLVVIAAAGASIAIIAIIVIVIVLVKKRH